MIWVINCNSNICRIYEFKKKFTQLHLVKELQHPENKLKSKDLTSDKPGRYQSSHSAHGTYTQPSDPKEIKIDHFYREIAKELDQGRCQQRYDELIIIAPPHSNGLLFQHLDKHVQNLVINNIKKDLLHLPDHELVKFLSANAQYHTEP
ncbi:MAG TPA: host attachment protein [Gammaproteobacteria bacterium]|nr:host attachment protein [Gammaproteobacteria bacterium]